MIGCIIDTRQENIRKKSMRGTPRVEVARLEIMVPLNTYTPYVQVTGLETMMLVLTIITLGFSGLLKDEFINNKIM